MKLYHSYLLAALVLGLGVIVFLLLDSEPTGLSLEERNWVRDYAEALDKLDAVRHSREPGIYFWWPEFVHYSTARRKLDELPDTDVVLELRSAALMYSVKLSVWDRDRSDAARHNLRTAEARVEDAYEALLP